MTNSAKLSEFFCQRPNLTKEKWVEVCSFLKILFFSICFSILILSFNNVIRNKNLLHFECFRMLTKTFHEIFILKREIADFLFSFSHDQVVTFLTIFVIHYSQNSLNFTQPSMKVHKKLSKFSKIRKKSKNRYRKNRKIAVCISGQLRGFRFGSETLIEHLAKPWIQEGLYYPKIRTFLIFVRC